MIEESPPLSINTEETLSFVRNMSGNRGDLIALMSDGTVNAKSFLGGDDSALEHWVTENNGKQAGVYFHVNELKAAAKNKKADKSDIAAVRHLHIDIDNSLDLERLREFPIPPTAVVCSGNGHHGYWSLIDPSLDFERCEAANRALATLLGGDKSTFDVTRILRLPGTINFPTKQKIAQGKVPRLAYIVHELTDYSRKYRLDQFATEDKDNPKGASGSSEYQEINEREITLEQLRDEWKVPKDILSIIEHGPDPARPKKQDNSRSAWLFQVICALVELGVPDDVILGVLLNQNYLISESVLEKGKSAKKYAARQIERAKILKADPVLKEMNAEHAVVENYGLRTVIFTFKPDGTMFHRSFEDFRKSYDNIKIKIKTGKDDKFVGKGQYFIEHRHRRQYKGVEFLPGKETPEDVLNLYRGSAVLPKQGDCTKFLAFITDVICGGNKKYAEWLLNHIAHIFQKPWQSPEICVVLRGGQGVGKNFFVERLGSLTEYFIMVTDPKHLVGSFNRQLMDKLIVFADEAFFAGNHAHARILKNLVTQATITVEPKGVDAFQTNKFFRLFMASNEEWVMALDVDDRRYFALDVSSSKAQNHEYFGELFEEWINGGREAFLHEMMQRDITKFNHRLRPETPALYEQKIRSFEPVVQAVFEMLESGTIPTIKEGNRYFVSTDAVRARYLPKWNDISNRALARELGIIARAKKSVRYQVGHMQPRGFWLPSLAICRERFEAAKRIKYEWPDPEGNWNADTSEDDQSEYPF